MMSFLRSGRFWVPFLIVGALAGAFFLWELGFLSAYLRSLPRVEPTPAENVFTASLVFLLAVNAGLYSWQKRYGSCPVGTRHASGIGGAVGAFALLCPVCLLLPLSLFGASLSLVFFAPFIPLFRIIAILLLVVSTILLWPRKKT